MQISSVTQLGYGYGWTRTDALRPRMPGLAGKLERNIGRSGKTEREGLWITQSRFVTAGWGPARPPRAPLAA